MPPNTLSFNQRFSDSAHLTLQQTFARRSAQERAHDEGKTQLDGRTVERIRIDFSLPCCPDETAYWYVDPETFYPVETHAPGVMASPGLSCDPRSSSATRSFEYLPRTAANLALTDIRAQHPDATWR